MPWIAAVVVESGDFSRHKLVRRGIFGDEELFVVVIKKARVHKKI